MAISIGTVLSATLAATLFWSVGCTASDDPHDEAIEDEASLEVSSTAETDMLASDKLVLQEQNLFGCSNKQIRFAQDWCRRSCASTGGSRGIHYCDQRPPNAVFQCDCINGTDFTVSCSLSTPECSP